MPLPKLDIIQNKNIQRRYICTHVFPELTALCPITRLPDNYTVKISYEPSDRIIELKSLKLYLIGFRDTEILHEEIINKILDDFIEVVQPKWAFIQVKVNIRGGISTEITRYWNKEQGDIIEMPVKLEESNI